MDRGHVVAGQVADRHLLAELLVVDEVGDEDAKARPPRALDACVVVALLRERGRRGPAHERRPTMQVARWAPASVIDHLLEDAVGALLVMRAARWERVGGSI